LKEIERGHVLEKFVTLDLFDSLDTHEKEELLMSI
jgi:hypothetical protein